MAQTNDPYKYVFSLGYRCSAAGILKSLGLKHESHPFDWLVSRLPIIEHCIETEFDEFLNPHNYQNQTSTTYNYTSLDSNSRQFICDESICVNTYYETNDCTTTRSAINADTIHELYLPLPICPEHDAYGHKLMMNHRNIKNNRDDREYFARCVERWNQMLKSSYRKLSLYIHPALFYEEFLRKKERIIDEIKRSFRYMRQQSSHDGIYIIVVKTPFDYPTNHCAKYVLEEQPDDESIVGFRICILWANRDFIDAGEIFMGNCQAETYVLKEYLQRTVENRGLLQNSAQ